MNEWLQSAFKKFAEFPVWGWAVIAALVVVFIVLWAVSARRQKTRWTTQMLALGAVCIALNCVLGMIRIWKMPNGGSITPASMLPVMLFAYVYGTCPGLLVGALCGVLDYMLGGYFMSVAQWLVDYPVAFAMMGLAGLTGRMKNERAGLTIGITIASVGRLIAAIIAGVFFWAENAPEGMSLFVYALTYNGSYMVPECIICILVGVLIGPRMVRELRKAK